MSLQSFCKVSIPTFRTYEHNNEITLYQVDVQIIGAMSWRIEKRFSDFYDLDTLLRGQFQHLPNFPGKTINKLKTNEQIERRKQKLNAYLEAISSRIDVVTSRTYNLFFDFEKFAPKYIFESPLVITATNSQYQIKNCQYIQGTDHLLIVTGQNEGFKQMMAFMQNKDNQLVEPLGTVECLTIKDNQVVKKWEKLFQLQGQCLHYSDSTLVIGFAKGQIIVYQLDSELSEPTIQTSYQTHKGRVNGVYYENINKIIYSISQDGSVIATYRDFLKQKSQLVLKDELTSLLVCENRQIAFIGSNRGAVYLLDISSSDFKQILRLDGAEKQKICDFAINTKDGFLFLAQEQNKIHVIDIEQPGREKHSKFKASILSNERPKRIAYCQKRQHLYLGDTTGCISVHNAVQGQPIYSLRAYEMDQVISLLCYIEEKDVVISFGKNSLKIWRFPTNWLDLNEIKHQEFNEIRIEQINKQALKVKENEQGNSDDDDELHNWHRNSK